MQLGVNELTMAQQVFAIFYAIFFGTMLQTVGAKRGLPSFKNKNKNKYIVEDGLDNASLNLFDTPNAWAIGPSKNNKPALRALISIFMLNLLPGYVFALLFKSFGILNGDLSWIQIVGIVWLSLAPHWIYRVFYAFLTKFYESLYITSMKIEKDFNKYDLAAIAVLHEDRLRYKAHANPYFHIAFPLFFYLPTAMLTYTLIMGSLLVNSVSCCLDASAVTLLTVGFVLFVIQIKKI